ncbi:HNH endonuclease [Chitinophaga rhizophila]|uniref:HNH endonuclease 5 domain-containing protein n=1 Tax=Chitinophaga rhizophila TaxID=2866212 RepID=A0ABS7G800_9BACT|nr:HNH endonuclease [Chitinophaga rhizophila]MBW8683521.1 hypothetical protein [Chitinophaga rhizophila]
MILPPAAEELLPEYDDFFSSYSVDLFFHPLKRAKLSAPTKRSCRFCNKSYPEVTFKKIAHMLPELMGNKNFISEFECDSCNSYFSKYETDLASFLGITRTLNLMKGKNSIPKFKNPDKKLEISFSEDRKNLQVISDGLENKHWVIDEKKKTITFLATKSSYIPLNIFKILLKIGFSFLREQEDIANLQSLNNFLLNEELNHNFSNNPQLRVFIHFLAGKGVKEPLVIQFKKRNDAMIQNCPTLGFIIYFSNYVFQFFMPGHIDDHKVFSMFGNFQMPPCPILLGKKYTDRFGIPVRQIVDFSSAEKKIGESQKIVCTYESIHYHEQANFAIYKKRASMLNRLRHKIYNRSFNKSF